MYLNLISVSLCQARKLDLYFETEEKLMSKSALVKLFFLHFYLKFK